MDNKELDKLEALAKAATPGPWTNDRGYLDGPPLSYSECYFENYADAELIAAANPAAILELIALARAGTTAPAAPTDEKVETDMADRLRRIVTNIGEGPIAVTSKLLLQAADECDRFYNGMMNWKASAQAKDRIIIEQREALAAPAAAQDAKDAARYRAIKQLMETAKGSAHLTVNQHLAYYEEAEAGKEVSLQWYPDTPIGFYIIECSTLDQVADEAIAAATPEQSDTTKGQA